ncbi:hypothetical protein KGQ20_13870 [Catenulispora sp. NF23]|uniref:hypothetical protein n=1 Tax=Catenulispora pinistramenti TaxID=2705254 RepID=UPI001BA52FF1|nr:hypothetical protein [Catenulispora pinistramenti]MBS2533856.1 hypothetical protein [Catenulispora pinistramenti]
MAEAKPTTRRRRPPAGVVERSLRTELESHPDTAKGFPAMTALAGTLARSIDGAANEGTWFAVSQLAPRYVEILGSLKLTPETAPEGPSELDGILDDITAA